MFRRGGTCPGGASYVTRSALPIGGPFYDCTAGRRPRPPGAPPRPVREEPRTSTSAQVTSGAERSGRTARRPPEGSARAGGGVVRPDGRCVATRAPPSSGSCA
ncbi:hypothetical protein B1H29_08655 [Streptomyces pactum]|uniref:Uncharacterized protein n=1 Tax=Streptomyces pactum TaxID=68249 RepID=A0A1S6J5D8_9ACTN|nr:hypothetical protein B1H29_08655 [Streptomyces pactum]